MVLSRVEETPQSNTAMASNKPSLFLRYLGEIVGLVVFSAGMAGLVIAWEDVTCTWALPSRHRTSLSLVRPHKWGMSTVHGMGFGQTERQLLADEESIWSESSDTREDDTSFNIPSYNEVMLRHRTETIPSWKQEPTDSTVQEAIHTVTTSVQAVAQLQALVQDYQWDEIRTRLHSVPLVNLPRAASVLRQVSTSTGTAAATHGPSSLDRTTMPWDADELRTIVGFDWGSCAWRHCGALADVQEATDELEQLLGVLEPYEATFCLDIVERSLREILAVLPWRLAAPADVEWYRQLPLYESKVSFQTQSENEESDMSRIDAAYFQALRDLRID